jgi:agmatinase
MVLSPGGVPKIYGDVPPFMAFPHQPDLVDTRADAVIVGMPYDGIATFRGGATRRAPQEIRKYSLLFGTWSIDWDLDLEGLVSVVDAGDVDVLPGDTPESYARLERRLEEAQATGAVPIMIGGDHGVTYPAVRAVARHRGGPLGVVLFDSHLDLSESFNDDRLTRASPVRRLAELPEVDPRRVVIIGAKGSRNLKEWKPAVEQLGLTIIPVAEVEARGIAAVTEEALELAAPDGRPPYVSIDIDSVDPAYAPGTNSPEPGGFTSREIITGVRIACRDGFAGLDVVEVAPDWDGAGGITSLLAARLLAEGLFCLAAQRAGATGAWRAAHSWERP